MSGYLQTKRLNFRPLSIGDEKYTFPEIDEDLTKYYIGWEPPKNLAEEAEFIKNKIKKAENPPNLELIAFDNSNNFIGCCGINPSEEKGEYEINMWVKRSEQGKGYGKEMLAMIVDWVKENTNLDYLVYSFTEGNEASSAIIRKMKAPLFRKVIHTKRGKRKQVFDHKIALR